MTPRTDTAARAGARLVVGLLGVLAVGVVAVPLALLVRSGYGPLLGVDADVSAWAEEAVSGSPALLRVAQAVTLLGDPVGITVVAATPLRPAISASQSALGELPSGEIKPMPVITTRRTPGEAALIDRSEYHKKPGCGEAEATREMTNDRF